MACGNSGDSALLDDEEDCDVIFEGSPLHEHLQRLGMSEEAESRNVGKPKSEVAKKKRSSGLRKSTKQSPFNEQGLLATSQTMAWPKDCNAILEIEIAQKIMQSELLVQEDQDFLSNFILTEEAFAEYEKKVGESSGKTSSLFGDVLLFSGSIAAVAGTILYLSERTRLATTVAAVLPTALAAFSTCRMGSSKAKTDQDKEQFLKLIDLLLSDMKLFKQLVRKSLNLLQGMELMNAGYLFAVNKVTGAASTSSETRLATHHHNQASFPALRLATYKCTVQLLEAYREALAKLMEVSPLADYIDMKDHYIAFVDLECFGIEDSSSTSFPVTGDAVSIKALKDTAQLALVQQSEYLRRFSLVFSEKVREDNDLNKSGILKQIREMATTLKNINTRLSKVFEYHQAMGLNPEQKAVSLKQKQLQFNFVPMRSLYTSLFSTGLHLQNSLLKVRQMEKLFDAIEKAKKEKSDEVNSLIPSEHQLIEWLKGFQDVQTELNACVGCLEEGVSQINVLQGDDGQEEEVVVDAPQDIAVTQVNERPAKVIQLIDGEDETGNENFDEVFEAFVAEERCSNINDNNGFEDELTGNGKHGHSNKILMNELKQVLVGKAEEHRVREEKALERKLRTQQPNGQVKVDNNGDVTASDGSNSFSSTSHNIFDKNVASIITQVVNENLESEVLKAGNENGRVKKDVIDGKQESHQNGNGTCQNGNGHMSKAYSGLTGFENFLDEDTTPDQFSSNVDPFCPNGTSRNLGKNCFEDNFLSSDNSSETMNELNFSKDTDESNVSSDDENGSIVSSSSSHPSTIRSVGRRVHERGTVSEICVRGGSSSCSDSSGEDFEDDDEDLPGNPDPVKPNELETTSGTRLKQFSKKKKRHRNVQINDSLPKIVREKSKNDVKSRISVSEIRSFSTPDLKLLAAHSSPYISLEDVSPKHVPANCMPPPERRGSSSSGSSDSGSMDELENYTLKTFRRPLRPAAMASHHRKYQFKSRKSENSSTETEKVAKECTKETEKVHNESSPKVPSDNEANNHGTATTKATNGLDRLGATFSSVYRQKHQDQIREISQPTGFDSSLAKQVVARAQNFGKKFNFLQKEEVFGSD